MARTVLAVIGGLLAWVLIVTLLNFSLRVGLPGYRAAEPAMAFTLAMKLGRLAIAVLTGLAAGAIVRWIAPASKAAPWIVGLVLLVLFAPEHARLWTRFPVWYHLFFLLTLAPLVVLGAARPRRDQPTLPA